MTSDESLSGSARWKRALAEHRFAVLLGALLLMLAGPSVLSNTLFTSNWIDLILALVLMAGVASLGMDRRHRQLVLMLGIPTVLFTVGGFTLASTFGTWIRIVGFLFAMFYFFMAAGLTVLALFRPHSLSADTILGSICGYLFLGLGWAMAFAIVDLLNDGAFEIGSNLKAADPAGAPATGLLIYYSFVTLTTIGYGDISPIAPAARALAWLEAISGQFYLAVVVAGIVSMMLERTRESSAHDSTD